MTVARLSDVIVSSLWTPIFVMEDPTTQAFFRSGIVAVDPVINNFAESDSLSIIMRHLNPIDKTLAENLSSDDPSQLSTPNGISMGSQKAVKIFRNQSWASMDLVAAFLTPDPVLFIRGQLAEYWVGRFQAYTAAVCKGITAQNVAVDNGDMVFDATALSGGAQFMSADSILLAKQTMGDKAGKLKTIVMHSLIETNLNRQNLIQYLRDADMNLLGKTYLGYNIIVDDDLAPVNTGTTQAPVFVYTSYMFGPGFIRWGTGTPKTPTALQRVEAAGNGEGEETLYNRQHWVGHPTGFSWNLDETTAAGSNPSNATLALAGSWIRKWPRKLVPFVAIKTLG